MKRQFLTFVVRWAGNSLVFVCLTVWPGSGVHLAPGWLTLITASLLITLLNVFLKPLIVFIGLPFLFITLGFFSLLINGLMVFLAAAFYDKLVIETWWWAMIAGLGLALANYLITIRLRPSFKEHGDSGRTEPEG